MSIHSNDDQDFLRDALPAALVMHLVVIASALLAGLWAWGTMRTRPTSPAS
jgi:hypothetical protein